MQVQKIDLIDHFTALPPYDAMQVYNDEIAPLLKAIETLCVTHEIPMLTFVVPLKRTDGSFAVAHTLTTREGTAPAFFLPSLEAFANMGTPPSS